MLPTFFWKEFLYSSGKWILQNHWVRGSTLGHSFSFQQIVNVEQGRSQIRDDEKEKKDNKFTNWKSAQSVLHCVILQWGILSPVSCISAPIFAFFCKASLLWGLGSYFSESIGRNSLICISSSLVLGAHPIEEEQGDLLLSLQISHNLISRWERIILQNKHYL
jgi:hypothetical protein